MLILKVIITCFTDLYTFLLIIIYFIAGSNSDDSLPIDVSFMQEIWSPDAEIRNLKEFKSLKVLKKVTH